MIYYIANPGAFYIKQDVVDIEYFMHKYVYSLGIVNMPEVVHYCSATRTMVMRRITGDTLSNRYGEDATSVPDEAFYQVIQIVRSLVLGGIQYPDLTGYNFIEDDEGVVWIIDFEHSRLMLGKERVSDPMSTICNAQKVWNEDFR